MKIYRRKFVATVMAILLIAAVCFTGAAVFFMNIWAGTQSQRMQDRFLRTERKIASVKDQLDEYVDSLYGSRSMMQDAKAFFEARSDEEYLSSRHENSLGSSAQISYLPGNMRKLFVNNRLFLRSVTFRSQAGIKAVCLDPASGYVDVTFGLAKEEDVRQIRETGDLPLLSIKVRDPDSISKQLGEITFWVNREALFQDIDPAESFAVLQRGEILYGEYGEGMEKAWMTDAARTGESRGWFLSGSKQPVYYTLFQSSQYDCVYVSAVSMAMLWQSNRSGLGTLIITVFIVAAGAILISFAGICHETRFLSHIMSMLGAMENGNFAEAETMDLRVGRQSEYTVIASALQEVSRKLEGYIKKEYILKLKQQEAAMRALRNQINPHFLYNTLESIRAKALVLGDVETAEAIAQLGSLYRGVVRCPDEIELKEEFNLLDLYLKIMSLRFAGNFVYQLELDEDVEHVKTLSFWLQPLAENFFNHGMDRSSEFNLLIVEGRREEDGARVTMTDNGIGMSEERLLETRKNMYEGKDDSKMDIGLRNVFARLLYYYGEGFCMEIGNQPEGGVCISIRIPAIGEKV